MNGTTDDYRKSISMPDTNKMFSDNRAEELAYQWQDKPHRHVFDLCNEIDLLTNQLQIATTALKVIKKECHRNKSMMNSVMDGFNASHNIGILAAAALEKIGEE